MREINEHKILNEYVVVNSPLHIKEWIAYYQSAPNKLQDGSNILFAWKKAENNDADSNYNALHLVPTRRSCSRKKGDGYHSLNMRKFKYWLNTYDGQAMDMKVLITWTQIQVAKFNVDGDMTSASQEQLRLYIYGVSFVDICPKHWGILAKPTTSKLGIKTNRRWSKANSRTSRYATNSPFAYTSMQNHEERSGYGRYIQKPHVHIDLDGHMKTSSYWKQGSNIGVFVGPQKGPVRPIILVLTPFFISPIQADLTIRILCVYNRSRHQSSGF